MKLFSFLAISLFCLEALAGPAVIWNKPYPKALAAGITFNATDGVTACDATSAKTIRYNAGNIEVCDGSSWTSLGGGGSSGTVTSVAMTVPTFLSIAGSPITTSGTLAVTLSGTALPIANGGTAATSAAAAFNALSPLTTGGDLLYGGASGAGTRLANGSAGDVLSSQGTTVAPHWITPATANTVSTLVLRDGSGNFTAGTITATGFTGPVTGRVNSTQVVETVVAGGTCSTTYTVDPTTGTMFNVTLNGACQFAVTNLAAGHSFTIKMTQSSTTTPTFAAAYKWASATAPTWSSSATKFDMVACVSLDGTTLDCSGVVDVR